MIEAKPFTDPWENLASAIIIQATYDWRKAIKRLRRNPDNEIAKRELIEVESFLRSSWCHELSNVPGEKILTMLREEAENDC